MTDPVAPSLDAPRPPARGGRGTVALVAGLLLVVGILVLGLHGPRFEAEGSGDADDVAVTCGSLLTVGWPTDGSWVDSEGSRSYGDHVREGRADEVARAGIARDCSERRDTYLALMVLLAVPASVCLSAAVARRRAAQPL